MVLDHLIYPTKKQRQMRRICVMVLTGYLFCHCKGGSHSKDKVLPTRIEIVNKTYNKEIKHAVTVTDPGAIKEFVDLVEGLQKYRNPKVAASLGYFEYSIDYPNGEKKSLDVIYTIYDGIIIDYERGYFKNDKLLGFTLGKFQ